MHLRLRLPILFVVLFSISGFSTFSQSLSDKKATKTTNRLYKNLHATAQSGLLFGHQDDLVYGVGWWAEKGHSDVKRAIGKYPAVFGWDIGALGSKRNLDSVLFRDIQKKIIEVYKMGGINTISWHIVNPSNGLSSWDTTNTVKHILPGGKHHEDYLNQLDDLSKFIKGCKVGLFKKVPLVFRPFHEHNGDWFWWGKGRCTEEEYIELWHFTMDYLTNEKNIHQLIYAFSPDRSRMDMSNPDSYFYGYPGDDYVDVIGLDNYWDTGHAANHTPDSVQSGLLTESIELIDKIARERGKIAALTETGKDCLTKTDWYTTSLLAPIKEAYQNNQVQIAWVMVWRNFDMEHFYVPYEGHPAMKDFKDFANDPKTLFLPDIKNPYK